ACRARDTMRSGIMSGFNVKANSNMGSFLFLEPISVRFRPAVSKELPNITAFLNFIQIQIRSDDFLFIARALRNDLAARRAEITLAIELTDVPRMLASNAVDRADEVTIRHRM